jgi:tetratricopeptide (TPR) repeat protein
LWLPALLLAAVAAILGVRYLSHLKPAGQLAGYISSSEVLEREYLQFEGTPLHNVADEQAFHQAAIQAGQGEFRAAALMLDSISKDCAEPVVFHDLGVLYAQMNDRDRALRAFREALARDPGYAPVRLILNSLRGFSPHDADPVTTESEPNATYLTANPISLDVDVVGEISSSGDLDCYRFSAPASPRDVLRIAVKSQSVTLAPRITVYDDVGRPTGEIAESTDPGAGASLLISPKPNSTVFVEVAGNLATSGAYALKVTATHSFDKYEPNEEITAARQIVVGREIEANIMTGDDRDFYFFVAGHTGKMVVTLRNQSASLVPALSTFGPDQRLIEFAVEATEPDKTLSRSLNVEEAQQYYVQVFGQSKSTGNYTLVVK